MKAERFFTDVEKERLKTAVQDVESRTIGEVVVAIADQSDRYADAEIIGSLLVASVAALILSLLFFYSSILWFLALIPLLFFPSYYLVKKVPRLKTVFLGLKRKESAVEQRALRAFYEHGLYKTKENTGVLFFLSLLERNVWILADKGIYQKIGQETLNRFAKTVSRGIKEGHACDALCDAIQDVGELLSTHFPMKPGDTDELPDSVIIEKL